MTEEKALQILKERFAKFAFKYPVLVKELNSNYISKHPNFPLALGECVWQLSKLDSYVNTYFNHFLESKL